MASALAIGFSAPTTAYATADHFCGFLYPNQVCINNYQSHWDRVRSRYPGAQGHGVDACVYMWNFHTGQMRGGQMWCNPTWSTPTWNPMGHNYGVTTYSYYRSLNLLPGSESPHTLVGWTSDNQSDG